MNIAQELSIVRDNIAEYGMTNITQLEYDAIYQQGRADALKEAFDKTYNKAYDSGYQQGRAEAIDDVIKKLAESEDTILTDKQYYTLMEIKEQKNG